MITKEAIKRLRAYVDCQYRPVSRCYKKDCKTCDCFYGDRQDVLDAILDVCDYIDTDGMVRIDDFVTWLGKFCRHIDMGDRSYSDDEAIAFFKKKLNDQFGVGGENDN